MLEDAVEVVDVDEGVVKAFDAMETDAPVVVVGEEDMVAR